MVAIERTALERSEERFRLLVENVLDYGIFMLTPDGVVDSWNAGASRLKGYTREEIVGKHFSIFYPAVDVAAGKCERELAEATRDGRFEDEGWRVRKDGSLFWANVVISTLRDNAGTLIGFAKVTRDLTERKRAEEEAQRFKTLVETVKDYAIFLLSPAGIVDSWNEGAKQLKGYTTGEIVGQHFSIFYPAEDVTSGKCERELDISTRVGRFEDEGWRLRKDESRFWANVIITALTDASGKLMGFAKVTRDLTERRQAEERLRALAAEKAVLAKKARVQEFRSASSRFWGTTCAGRWLRSTWQRRCCPASHPGMHPRRGSSSALRRAPAA